MTMTLSQMIRGIKVRITRERHRWAYVEGAEEGSRIVTRVTQKGLSVVTNVVKYTSILIILLEL